MRELKNTIEQAVLTARDSVIEPDDLAILRATEEPDDPIVASSLAEASTGARSLTEVECDAITDALSRCGGNVSRTARLLGVSRDTLRYRMEKYQLK